MLTFAHMFNFFSNKLAGLCARSFPLTLVLLCVFKRLTLRLLVLSPLEGYRHPAAWQRRTNSSGMDAISKDHASLPKASVYLPAAVFLACGCGRVLA